MRYRLVLLTTMVAAVLPAEALDPRLIRLVPADARLVAGMDFDRYRLSRLAMPKSCGVH